MSDSSSGTLMDLPVTEATAQTVAPFGELISDTVTQAIDIPYYRGRVIEGGDIGFKYRGRAALRTAQVLPSQAPEVHWLERHLHLTQLFVGLDGPYVMVLAPPGQSAPDAVPDLTEAVALRFPASSALLLHLGTWHDFPIAVTRPVTLLIGNSEEVVDALQRVGGARELHEGDVHKISLTERLGVAIRPRL
ncbi:ureidoglycolate lyase [Nonomuraea angiospora]|uniref:ureidoglycolate lyase n=1 Tax=Nonomuraea angiospora TaxID=46172 RepID=UPI0029B984D0|nr:ureidoglycolate lyase [Nonomuraea angiospora]MDX3103364.1 ureidoglycolate lyase [Nonomuraea angiospora]